MSSLSKRVSKWAKNSVLMVFLVLVVVACKPRDPNNPGVGMPAHFQQNVVAPDKPSHMLSFLIDTSGSFAGRIEKGGVALKALKHSVGSFCQHSVSQKTKIFISQLSCQRRARLWEGSCGAFRRQFRTAKSFGTFLLKHSDPSCSRVYDAVHEAINFALNVAGGPKTKHLMLIFSDLENNGQSPGALDKMKMSLARYGKAKGALAIYWASSDHIKNWKGYLRSAGIRQYNITSDLNPAPQLPKFTNFFE